MTNGQVDVLKLFTITRMLTSANGKKIRVIYWSFERRMTGEFPSQRPVTRSFDAFFDLRVNKRLSKQWRRRRFEAPSRSLWRQCRTISNLADFVLSSVRSLIKVYSDQSYGYLLVSETKWTSSGFLQAIKIINTLIGTAPDVAFLGSVLTLWWLNVGTVPRREVPL